MHLSCLSYCFVLLSNHSIMAGQIMIRQKTLDYVGTVQESVYENPHATIKVQQDKKTWLVVLAPVSRMEARGVTADMIKKGATVQVVGYPHKKIKDEMRAERVFIDGNKYELR